MYFERSPKTLWRLVSAGTLMTILGLSGLTNAYGQQGNEWGGALRRNRNPASASQAARAPRGTDDDDDDDILQVLEEDMAPPPEGAKVQPEGDGPPAGTDPLATPEAAPPAAPWGLTDIFDDGCGNCLKDNQWKIGGNIDQSFTGNFSSPRDRYNGPVTWTDRSNEYQLNQFWLYFERATDTSKKDWDIGGRFDAFLGTNARFDTETGLENNNFGFNSSHSNYGIALPQFYIETAYKSLKIKWGHFISPVGYFTVDMTQNFFNTLPYTFQYGEPFTHTGAIATWVVNEKWTLGGGVVRGWDNFDASGTGTNHMAAIGMVTRTWADKSSFYFFNIFSDESNSIGTNTSPRYLQTMVYSKPIDDKWTYVAQSDLGIQTGTANVNGTDNTSRWYGLNQYIYYVHNDKWTWGLNGEWFRDEEGFRVGGFLPVPPGSSTPGSPNFVNTSGLSTARAGFAGNFFQTTMGPKWQFHKNMFLRPNLRFDYFDGPSNSGGLLPFGDGNKHWQGILATDLAVVF